MAVINPITSMKGAYDISGYNVVVTGGNRGIGFGISTAFAQSGANVAILCRDVSKGAEAAAKLKEYGGDHHCFACDVSKLEDVRKAAKSVFDVFGKVNVLVNNSGVAPVARMLEDKDLEKWHQTIDTNLHGPANTIHSFVPSMIKNGGGSVISISSVGGQSVSAGLKHFKPGYHAAKAGLDILTRYLCIELGGSGMRFNVIAPGLTHSDLDKDLPPGIYDFVDNALPSRRFGEPIEIGAYCVYLASPAAANINGTICVLDGGKLCTG
ncbi:MAG: SDR family oxidoreductase [Oscillospiraceae bacterium]|nr:SDR family oxidoreductase [Oscillospiraceae bacterium]